AVVLALVFGVVNIPGVGHGALYRHGAYVTYFFLVSVGMPYVVAILGAALALAIVGMLLERLVFHPIRTSHIHHMIAAVGVMFFLQSLVKAICGADFRRIESLITGRVSIFEIGRAHV